MMMQRAPAMRRHDVHTRASAPHIHAVGLHRSRSPRQPSTAVAAAPANWDAPPAVVVGAGIAGLAAAVALHRVGAPVLVLEQRQGSEPEGSAIGLWDNAWTAMDTLGVADTLRPNYLRLRRVELCQSGGKQLRAFGFEETGAGMRAVRSQAAMQPGPSLGDAGSAAGLQPCGSEFRGVLRADLVQALAAALPVGTIRASARVTRIETETDAWPVAVLEDGSRVEAGLLVGADGVRSVVAGRGGLNLPPPTYSGYTAYRGVAQLPAGLPSIGLPPDTIRQVWGRGVRAGLYPLTPTSCYWFTCVNAAEDAAAPGSSAAMKAEVGSQVAGWGWGVPAAIRCTAPAAISRSRIIDRWTLGAFGRGLVTLCGDAMHPMTPNLGQGGCTALEDAVVLGRTVAESVAAAGGLDRQQLAAALRRFEWERSARCLPITVRSYGMGAVMQSPLPPVCWARDTFVSTLFDPSHFLDHTTFDAGELPAGLLQAAPSRVLA